MEQQNDEFAIDLLELFYVIRSRILIIILSAVVFAAGAIAYTHYLITPLYSSTSSIYVLSKESVISYSDFMVGTSLTNDYMQMIKTYTVLDRVIKNLNLEDELTVDMLKGCISVYNPEDTRMLTITVRYYDPNIAKEIVDEVAEVSVERISQIMDVEEPNIYETGQVSESPVSPNVKKNALIAGLFGALLAAAIFIILYLKDDSICTPEDVEKYLKLNTLAVIPVESGSTEQIRIDERKRTGRKKRRSRHKNHK